METSNPPSTTEALAEPRLEQYLTTIAGSSALHEDDDDARSGVDVLGESAATLEDDPIVTGDCAVQGLLESSKEASRLRAFRLMVVGMLMMTGIVTIMAFLLLSREETNKFETVFRQFASALANAAVDHQKRLVESMKTIGTEVTSHAQSNNMTWPYVVLPFFEASAMRYFEQSKGEFIGLNNFVDEHERESYTRWVNLHFGQWLKDSHMIRYGNLDLLDQDPAKYNPYISQRTPDGFPPDETRPYYTVRTVHSPPMRALGPSLNLNIATIPGTATLVESLLALRNETLITRIKPYTVLPEDEHQNFHTDSNADNPHSFMHQPIYEKVNDPTSKIVGTVTSAVAWDSSLQDLLPAHVEGIHCVIRNNCNQSFTYSVKGPDAYYLGKGSHYDPKYEHLGIEVELGLHEHPDFLSKPGHCTYTMQVFPSIEFEESYKTNTPATFAAVVFATFAFVAIVFFVYDCFVQRRNMELVTTAARSHQVVSALFPGEMKDHVLAQQSVSIPGGSKLKKSQFRRSRSKARLKDKSSLAKEYENATIFFGDLSGFTAWSARHSPEEVFELLETLYTAFDQLAQRRGVFKVETVGDCYVAATGVPHPQANHASRITRFADECIQRMDSLTAELAVSMGPETSNLKLRVGLHSGKVTGGVLKGDKARFQLFGDTMNTASRMETNGQPGRIHVSKATADELIASGKVGWLRKRDGGIVAKGKGEMETFFVAIPDLTYTKSSTGLSDSISDLKDLAYLTEHRA